MIEPCDGKDCIDKLDKRLDLLGVDSNKLHTRLTVLEKAVFGNGRPGVFQVLECMDSVMKDMESSIKLMRHFLDNNKSVFDTRLKVVGLWIAGFGLILNGVIGILRIILS